MHTQSFTRGHLEQISATTDAYSAEKNSTCRDTSERDGAQVRDTSASQSLTMYSISWETRCLHQQ